MARLRLRFKFNPGRHGAKLDKLGEFAVQVEKFLRSLADDLGVKAKKGEWLAENFANSSVMWDSTYAGAVDSHVYAKGNAALKQIFSGDPIKAVNNGMIGYGTLTEYSRIGKTMEPDEHFDVGIYEHEDATAPTDWKQVTYGQTAEIRSLLEAPYVSYGSLQGIMHNWIMEGKETSFVMRDLVSGDLIKCFYTQALHNKVHEATRHPTSVLIVYGDMSWDRGTNSVVSIDASDIEVTRFLTDAEFEGLFGSAPNYTGPMTSTAYIEWLRGDDE